MPSSIIHNLLEKYLETVKTFLPEKIVKPTVGLDVGTHSCKAVEVIPTENGLEILRWAIVPIVGGLVSDAIKKALSKMGMETKSPSVAVSGHGTLIRYMNLPRMSLEELRKSVLTEADKHFPFPKDQIYVDCYLLESAGKENQVPVLVAAAKKEIVDQRIKFLSEAGLQVNFIGINILAIANIFSIVAKEDLFKKNIAPEGGKSNIIAVLDMGETLSSLVILQNNLPIFTRDIFIGGRDLNKRIGNIFNVDMKEAERIKCDPRDKIEVILNACDSILVNLVSEARLSFDYLTAEKNIQVSKLYITGGASLLTGVGEFFSKNLDIPVEKWNPLPFFKIAPDISAGELNKDINQLGVALGLALYRYD